MSHICAEMQYDDVHSDLCIVDTTDAADRAVLHAALDEWLDRANGDGGFYIGNAHLLSDCPSKDPA